MQSTDQVKQYLDSITDTVEAALPRQADTGFSVNNKQPWDSNTKKGIVQSAASTSHSDVRLCEGRLVRVLSASKRYWILGIRDWQQMTRHFKKVSTANAVRQLLEPREDNSFAGCKHDLRMWQAAGEQHCRQTPWANCSSTSYGTWKQLQEAGCGSRTQKPPGGTRAGGKQCTTAAATATEPETYTHQQR